MCNIALIIAEKLDLSEDEKQVLNIGALLHDIGKLGIPDSILKKEGKLTAEEFATIKDHPLLGFNIAIQFIHDNNILSCIRSHHERYDGQGYPDRLREKEIPIYARIISVADAYHAMIYDRPYRKGLSKDYAIDELLKNKGSQFDPDIVNALIT